MKKVLVIVGPTASGKTDLSLKLAKHFNGEIISGDSIQIYRGFDIGSGKVMDTKGIVHYGIDELDAKDSYSVADFQKLARENIDKISANNKLAMIVGGTGLYIKACLYDYEFDMVNNISHDFSNMSNQQLFDMLNNIDPVSASKIHINNRVRLERALNICLNGENKSDIEARQQHELLYDALIIGCTFERDVLYKRINMRVSQMVKDGLLDEVISLLSKGVTFDDQPMKGIGYRQWVDYFNGNKTIEEVTSDIQKCSRQFAKRQYTWFNNQMKVNWVNMAMDDSYEKIVMMVDEWLNG